MPYPPSVSAPLTSASPSSWPPCPWSPTSAWGSRRDTLALAPLSPDPSDGSGHGAREAVGRGVRRGLLRGGRPDGRTTGPGTGGGARAEPDPRAVGRPGRASGSSGERRGAAGPVRPGRGAGAPLRAPGRAGDRSGRAGRASREDARSLRRRDLLPARQRAARGHLLRRPPPPPLPLRADPHPRSPARSLAPIAGMHHERCDGSGYYRQASRRGLRCPHGCSQPRTATRP